MEHITAYFIGLIKHTSYAGIFLVMVLGNLAIPAGTEIVLPTCGALISNGLIASFPLAFAAAVAGELVGGSLLWAIGRYGGVAFVHRFGRYVHLSEANLARIHQYYERFGARTVFICRFIPVVRGVAALPAGLSGMNIMPFLGYTLAGSAIFCGGLLGLGYYLGKKLDRIIPLLHKTGFALIGVAVLVVILLVVLQKRRAESSTPQKSSETV